MVLPHTKTPTAPAWHSESLHCLSKTIPIAGPSWIPTIVCPPGHAGAQEAKKELNIAAAQSQVGTQPQTLHRSRTGPKETKN